MGTSTTQVRADIARSRDELGGTIGALEERLAQTKEDVVDRVSPKRVWHRKTDELRRRVGAVTGSVTGMTERMETQVATGTRRVRGEVQGLAEQTSAGVSRATDGARGGQAGLRQRAEDNPMAAGLVALGAGVLMASLLPPTPAERKAALRLRDELSPLQEQASKAGRQVAEEVTQSAQERMEQVKSRAGAAVEQVKQETMASSEEVKSETQAASRRVKGEAKASTRRVKSEVKSEAKSGPRSGGASNGSSASKPAPRRRPVRAR